ncbi:hypothetical protein ABEW34_03850 [Paenibacillus algorifonticola]|uniref:transmembrane-type terpene cyclase n=1 Tax=Paenibacillus algorifonticola TaxID=684063 RepID=UPI003D2BC3C9
MMDLLLLLGMAFFWTITYLLIIYLGFKDRTCGMPLAALCANLTWELLFGFLMPFNPLQQIITIVWFALDIIILMQFLYYTRKDYSTKKMAVIVGSLLATAFLLHYGVSVEFHDPEGKYTAFGINLMMSILFIQMLFQKDLLGQSRFIAWAKMLGTLCASVLSYKLFPDSLLLMFMYVLIFLFDVGYILLVQSRSVKIVQRPGAKQGNTQQTVT